MPILFLTEHDTKSYGLKIENNELVKVQTFENIYDDENNILCVKPLETLLGKCEVCNMLLRLGALDKSVINGKTILLEISEENDKNKYVYAGADIILSFKTNDNIF